MDVMGGVEGRLGWVTEFWPTGEGLFHLYKGGGGFFFSGAHTGYLFPTNAGRSQEKKHHSGPPM